MTASDFMRALGTSAAAALDPPAAAEQARDRRAATVLLLSVLGAAILFRIYLLFTTPFPLNDGGFFIPFIREAAASFPALPESGAYNGVEVPFAYPPLAFWIGGLLVRLGADPVELLRVLPPIFNIVALLLFALLLLRTGRSRLFTGLVLLFLSTRLLSFIWLVMGGGFTRGLGSIFVLLALLAILPATAEGRRGASLKTAALAGAAVGGAILSHPEWGILAAASVVAAIALSSRSLAYFITRSFTAGICALLLILPWLLAVSSVHGIEPFFAAGQTSYWEAGKLFERLFSLVRTAISNPLIGLGVLVLLWRREPFWVAFILLATILIPRGGSSAVTWSLSVFAAAGTLAAYGLLRQLFRNRAVAIAVVSLAVITFNGVRLVRDLPDYRQILRPLTPAQRGAMAWVAANRSTSTFAVVTPENWGYDRAAEWFPYLTGATSVTTVQGSEWLPGRLFASREEMAQTMKAAKTCPDLLRALGRFGPVDLVWAELGRPCFAAAGYVPVYTLGEVTIFKAPAQP